MVRIHRGFGGNPKYAAEDSVLKEDVNSTVCVHYTYRGAAI
jgi:hypothetical protein